MMYYHKIVEGPALLESDGQQVEYFTILPANGGIEEPNTPVLAIEHDFTDKKLAIIKMLQSIDIHFDGKTYAYRAHIEVRDVHSVLQKIVVETDVGF